MINLDIVLKMFDAVWPLAGQQWPPAHGSQRKLNKAA
jgi:hypothetical protein